VPAYDDRLVALGYRVGYRHVPGCAIGSGLGVGCTCDRVRARRREDQRRRRRGRLLTR
jgi:hypothetical protein